MTYRLPSLNSLRAFEAAARHLSFKVAASEMGVTSGAVSQQVKKLETSLGVLMFRRLPHGLLLTVEGEVYLPRISKVFEDLTEATEMIAPDMNGKKFRIGICPRAADILPGNWPEKKTNLKPYVRDVVRTSDLAMVWNNEIDCLIRSGEVPCGDLASIPVESGSSSPKTGDALQYICKPGYVNCRQTQAILDDLAGQEAV